MMHRVLRIACLAPQRKIEVMSQVVLEVKLLNQMMCLKRPAAASSLWGHPAGLTSRGGGRGPFGGGNGLVTSFLISSACKFNFVVVLGLECWLERFLLAGIHSCWDG